jgi:RNA polymerase sigma-70 factor (ECF subfamily)
VDDTERLLDGLAEDVDAAFADLVSAYASLVYTVLLRQCGARAEADDLAQDTFLRAYTALRGYSPEKRRTLRLKPWLVTIAVNVWRNHIRERSRRPAIADQVPEQAFDIPDHQPGPAEQAANLVDQEVLAKALARLPERHRLAVVLRHVVGLSYAEAAEAMGCAVGTAKAQVSRGLATLRQELATQAEELTA